MQSHVWQRLFALETRDGVETWHRRLFSRDIGARRALEITSAAKQSREFFRNAQGSNDSVRALLGFYGVASLSRAALLLLSPGQGEEAMTPGHGLSAIDWRSTLTSDVAVALSSLEKLKIETCNGLFSDFLSRTENLACMHVHSENVDWRLTYNLPPVGSVVTLGDLLSRLPDLADYLPPSIQRRSAWCGNMRFSAEAGFNARVLADSFAAFAERYRALGYVVEDVQAGDVQISCDYDTFKSHTALFTHTYLKKMIRIPGLFISEPFEGELELSQIAMTYMLSYFLGMLTRYFPGPWVALASGAKGDEVWPAINAAQKYIEASFPELVLELILDRIAERDRAKT